MLALWSYHLAPISAQPWNKQISRLCVLISFFAHRVKESWFLGQHFGDPDGTAIRPCPDRLAVPDSGPDRTELQRAPTYWSGTPPDSLRSRGDKRLKGATPTRDICIRVKGEWILGLVSIKFNYKFNDSHGRWKGKVTRRRSARGAVIDQGGQNWVRILTKGGQSGNYWPKGSEG